MDFRAFLKKSADEIDTETEAFFATWSKDIAQLSSRLAPLARALGDASNGGKRIRGALVLLGYQIASSGNPYPEELVKIAVAYELFQTAVLAHDDIIDKSPLRRGKLSLYKKLGGDHYGISQTISLGDIGFFLAFRIIAESTFSEHAKNKAVSFFGQSVHDTVVGEMLDVELSRTTSVINEEDVLGVSRLKTAYYTFVGPLTLGAVLGGADDERLDAIKQYGETTGIAFQIRDDINDVFATSMSLRKEVGGDIKEGKQTLLFLKAKQKANKDQAAVLKNAYGNPKIGTEAIESVKKVFIETGALEYAESRVKYYNERARSVIGMITADEQMKMMLNEINDYIEKK